MAENFPDWGKSWVQFQICWTWSPSRKVKVGNIIWFSVSRAKNKTGMDETVQGEGTDWKEPCQHFKLGKEAKVHTSNYDATHRNTENQRQWYHMFQGRKKFSWGLKWKAKCTEYWPSRKQADFRKRAGNGKQNQTELNWDEDI